MSKGMCPAGTEDSTARRANEAAKFCALSFEHPALALSELGIRRRRSRLDAPHNSIQGQEHIAVVFLRRLYVDDAIRLRVCSVACHQALAGRERKHTKRARSGHAEIATTKASHKENASTSRKRIAIRLTSVDTDAPAHTGINSWNARREQCLAFAPRRNAIVSQERPRKAASLRQIQLLADRHVCEMERGAARALSS